MTAAEFRKIALGFPEAVEASHVAHPDFRVGGRIFATLGYPDERYGVLMLTPDEQQELLGRYPEMFEAVRGGWGRRGSTQVFLQSTSGRVLESAMKCAWLKRAPKRLLAGPEELGDSKNRIAFGLSEGEGKSHRPSER